MIDHMTARVTDTEDGSEQEDMWQRPELTIEDGSGRIISIQPSSNTRSDGIVSIETGRYSSFRGRQVPAEKELTEDELSTVIQTLIQYVPNYELTVHDDTAESDEQ